MLFLASNGYRCIAHDRRGHGRSSQPWNGNEMNTYADDLATLMDTLDLKNAVLIGFSAGGGEVARYIGRHGTKRLAKAALISAVPPLMLKTADNPGGLPIEKFDVPTLIIHGNDDQIVPIGAAALRSSKLVSNATLKIYAGAPHGLAATHQDQLNADLLEFIKT